MEEKRMNMEYSCGAVVFTRTGGEIRYVIICSLAGRHGFPKGHMEPGETEEDTALREIREEVGLCPRLIPGFRMVDEYPLPHKPGTWKQVVYFLAEYSGQALHPQRSELRSAALLPYDAAIETLEFDNIRRVLTEAYHFLEQNRP